MSKKNFKKTNLFTILTKFLLIVLPFYVIIKVYFSEVIWFGFFGFFIKEFIVVLLFLSLVYEFYKSKKIPKFDLIDYLIFAFIFYWILISFLNHGGIKEIIYWWRYDFLGFIVFLIFKHWKQFLKEKTKNLVKLFLLSASISLFFGILVKFILWEEFLSLFWYSIYVADFNFKGGIPIYQWVEASGIRRFQGILDSPLAMWFFLIIFSSLFAWLNRKNLDFAFFVWIIILFSFIFLTYSRAAMLWVVVWIFLLFLLNFQILFKKYRKTLIWIIAWIFIISFSLSFIFQDKLHNVFFRDGSTNGHFTRMKVWVERFLEKPLWSWLASAWPAYRYIVKETSLETDRKYIPESWFIQILVEGWIIYFLLYLAITWNILFNLYKNKHNYILAMFIWVLVMSVFLHIFEYTYLTIILFLFLGIFYSPITLFYSSSKSKK